MGKLDKRDDSMHIGGSITDELRKLTTDPLLGYASQEVHAERLLAIADRIDAEHDKALNSVDSAYDSGYNVGYDEGFASADDWMADNEDAMEEHGWVRLPVDADGVPIRIGDVLNPPAGCEDYVPLLVMRLTYDGYENEWFFDGEAGGFCGMVGEHMDVAGWTHHHTQTVEDVLLEFLDEAEHFHSLEEERDAISEYAKRLTLAGDAE